MQRNYSRFKTKPIRINWTSHATATQVSLWGLGYVHTIKILHQKLYYLRYIPYVPGQAEETSYSETSFLIFHLILEARRFADATLSIDARAKKYSNETIKYLIFLKWKSKPQPAEYFIIFS